MDGDVWTPFPVKEDQLSLSVILMDAEYYKSLAGYQGSSKESRITGDRGTHLVDRGYLSA